MRLFLGARFCVDAANVRLRIGIRTSSHDSKLTEQFQQSTRQTRGPRRRRLANRVRRRQAPGAPFLIVFVRWQQCVARMPFRSKPGDQLHQIVLGHGGASSGGPIHAAPDMKKNRAACARHWRIGIVANLDEPMISEISRTHFFMCVIVWRILRIDHDMPIVVRRARVIAPNISLRYLMVRIVAAGGQMRFVSKNLTNFENACRRATIAFFLSKTGLVLRRKPHSPGEPVFSKQHRKWSRHRAPITAARPFEEPQLAALGIPRGRHTHDELRAVGRNTIRMCMSASRYQ
jgi:hypothetical protein